MLAYFLNFIGSLFIHFATTCKDVHMYIKQKNIKQMHTYAGCLNMYTDHLACARTHTHTHTHTHTLINLKNWQITISVNLQGLPQNLLKSFTQKVRGLFDMATNTVQPPWSNWCHAPNVRKSMDLQPQILVNIHKQSWFLEEKKLQQLMG